MKRLLLLFALLAFVSVGTLSAQNRDREEIERLKAEIARLKGDRTARPEDIERLHKEADALYLQGKYREAKAKAIQAYAAFERLAVQDKATRVRHLRVLCNISNALQENDQTIEYAVDVSIYATKDGDRSFAYNNIGSAYSNKGDYVKAIQYYEKCLAIDLKTLGPEHPDIALSYNNIGLAYDEKGEDDKAIRYYEKSLAIKLTTLGPEHPLVALTYYNIGTAYAEKGDKRTAMRYLLKAKAILLKQLGPNHPQTKTVQSWIDGLNNE